MLGFLSNSNRLGKYQHLEEMITVLHQLDNRIATHHPQLSKREKLIDYRLLLKDIKVYQGLEDDFLIFFPELQKWVEEQINRPGFWR